VAVAQHVERGICVVFPLKWAAVHGQAAMIAHAKERIVDVEGKAGGKRLIPGSVLLAFTRHVAVMRPEETVELDVPRDLLTANPAIDPSGT
jgi:hypothetical protein